MTLEAPTAQSPDSDTTPGSLESMFTDAAMLPADTGALATNGEAPTESPEAPDPEPSGPSVETPASGFGTWRSKAESLGVSLDGVESEAALTERLLAQLERSVPYVDYARHTLPFADQIRELALQRATGAQPVPTQQTTQQPTQQAPAQPADPAEWTETGYFEKAYGGPAWTSEHQQLVDSGLVTRDPETGQYVAVPGSEFLVGNKLQEVNAAASHSAKFWGSLTKGNPLEALYTKFREPIERMVSEQVQQRLAQHQNQTASELAMQDFEQRYAGELFQVDEATGQQLWTAKGLEFSREVEALKQQGMTDRVAIVQTAARLVGLGAGAQTSQNIAPVAQPGQTPQPIQPTQPAQPVQQPQVQVQPVAQVDTAAKVAKSFIDRAVEVGGHAPSAHEPDGTPGPVTVTEADLENMFVNAVGAA